MQLRKWKGEITYIGIVDNNIVNFIKLVVSMIILCSNKSTMNSYDHRRLLDL